MFDYNAIGNTELSRSSTLKAAYGYVYGKKKKKNRKEKKDQYVCIIYDLCVRVCVSKYARIIQTEASFLKY